MNYPEVLNDIIVCTTNCINLIINLKSVCLTVVVFLLTIVIISVK